MNNYTNQINYGKFKIELKGVATRIVVIPEQISLSDLHQVIQAAFNWGDYHLWEFETSTGRTYGDEDNDFLGEIKLYSPKKAYLSDILSERGDKLKYTYDFGDYWCHVITRMADPKNAEGCYCVKTDGPDGIEDIGGYGGLLDNKNKWHIPDADEITKRLGYLELKPRKTKKNT